MTIKFAILNPLDGSYEYRDTIEDASNVVAEQALNLYMSHTQNAFLTVVETIEDAEKWYAPTGEQVLSPAEIQAKIARRAISAQALIDAQSLEITKLGI